MFVVGVILKLYDHHNIFSLYTTLQFHYDVVAIIVIYNAGIRYRSNDENKHKRKTNNIEVYNNFEINSPKISR